MVVLLLLCGGAVARGQVVDAEQGFVARIAQERSSRGLGALAFAEDLQVVARRHAQRMADRGEPYHNPDLGSEVHDWQIVAENVGDGQSVDVIHDAFMQSAQHRDIILHPNLTELGVGVVATSDGRLWVVEVFRRPQEQSNPEPQAQPAPQPRPDPSPPTTAERTSPSTRLPPAETASTSVPAAPPATVSAQAGPAEVPLASGAAPARVDLDGSAPISLTPAVADVAAEVPAQAWLAAFLLAAVVGLQGQVLRRLGLVA